VALEGLVLEITRGDFLVEGMKREPTLLGLFRESREGGGPVESAQGFELTPPARNGPIVILSMDEIREQSSRYCRQVASQDEQILAGMRRCGAKDAGNWPATGAVDY
jgi:hypothetical protein